MGGGSVVREHDLELGRRHGRGGALVLSLLVAAASQTGVGLRSTALVAGVLLGVGASAVGAIAGGLVADAFGLRAPFLIGAPLLVVAALAAGPALRAVRV